MFGVDAAIGIALLVLGIILVIFELTHPGAFLIIPAVVLIVVGLILSFEDPAFLTTVFGVLAIVVGGVLAAIGAIFWYRYMAPTHKPLSTTVDSLEGEVGLVIAPVVPDTLKGKVRVRSEVWSAKSDRPIPVGTHVKVIGGEGVSVIVQPVDAPSSTGQPGAG